MFLYPFQYGIQCLRTCNLQVTFYEPACILLTDNVRRTRSQGHWYTYGSKEKAVGFFERGARKKGKFYF